VVAARVGVGRGRKEGGGAQVRGRGRTARVWGFGLLIYGSGDSGPPSGRPAIFVPGQAARRVRVAAQARTLYTGGLCQPGHGDKTGRAVLRPSQNVVLPGGLPCCGPFGHLRDMSTPGSPRSESQRPLSSGPDLPEAASTYKWARRPYPHIDDHG
jgi:hypothetical protein